MCDHLNSQSHGLVIFGRDQQCQGKGPSLVLRNDIAFCLAHWNWSRPLNSLVELQTKNQKIIKPPPPSLWLGVFIVCIEDLLRKHNIRERLREQRNKTYSGNPSCRQTTMASFSSKCRLQIVPHIPSLYISTRPEWLLEPTPLKRMSPATVKNN